jgi:hypothetical protein
LDSTVQRPTQLQQTFIVRLWLEASDACSGKGEWRGSVQRVQDRKLFCFRHLKGIVDVLEQFVSDNPRLRATEAEDADE